MSSIIDNLYDVVVVGSGPSGAQCAHTLVDKGLKVLMLDGGNFSQEYDRYSYEDHFYNQRKNDEAQRDYLIGKDYEGIPNLKIKTGAQLTPARKFLLKDTSDYFQYQSNNFLPMESLAYGGLGSGWGLGSCVFSSAELLKTGLDVDKMNAAYQLIINRIGVTDADEDIRNYVLRHTTTDQGFIRPDTNHQLLLDKYKKHRAFINGLNVYMGRPALALLHKAKDNRLEEDYREWGFYTDKRKSAYRPWITIEYLKTKQNFTYLGNVFVLNFKDDSKIESQNEGVNVYYKLMDDESSAVKMVRANQLVLCAGALGSARILYRSEEKKPTTSLLCNSYSYVTCIQPALLFKDTLDARTSFAQLSMFYDPDNTNSSASMASLYSYRSLMLFRTISETPLNFRDANIIMRYLVPALTIAGIHHPDTGSNTRTIDWKASENSKSGDQLLINFEFNEQEKDEYKDREKVMFRALRKLGCYPIKTINPGNGASIHYAGTIPFSKELKPFTTSFTGKLNNYNRVYIGDGSGFNYLPAKGLTLSLMANAHVVASNLIAENY